MNIWMKPKFFGTLLKVSSWIERVFSFLSETICEMSLRRYVSVSCMLPCCMSSWLPYI